MSERIDHAAAAARLVAESVVPSTDAELIGVAQVHSTLALVEQQRIANLIAYVQLLEAQYAEAARHQVEFDWSTRADSVARHGIALDRIREGLGL